MQEIIRQKLRAIVAENSIKCLLACESGSRAWGFPSHDSDYDVRFIYVHQKEHYLGIGEHRDVIELPINDVLDINGWELRKALRLFRKSNAPIYEWLQSPVVYQKDDVFHDEMKKLMPQYFSPRSMMHHYLSMSKSVFEGDLAGEEVKLKKYFYALRPILACRWIADRKEVPPMEFEVLRTLLDPTLDNDVDNLLKQKSHSNEKFMIKPIEQLHAFIGAQIAYCEKAVPDVASSIVDSDRLNQVFRKYLA